MPSVRTHAAVAPIATLVLGHGAGAGQDHPWMTRVADGLAERGITVVTFDFPYVAQGRKVPDRGPVLETAFQTAWLAVAARESGPLFAGGKSMGGRIATQVAARGALHPEPLGLVCFGYPLHPPGKPAERRDRHLPLVKAPLLFLSGTRDPFGSPDELRDLVRGLPRASLTLFDDSDHSIQERKRKAGVEDPLERAIHTAADWMRQIVPRNGLERASERPRP
jgi:predicted alpha/beta-hydrolase family hydrolase